MTHNITGIAYLENDETLGFLILAIRRHLLPEVSILCFLNNDTQIRSRWLDNLVATIAQDKMVGCVESKLVFQMTCYKKLEA